MTLNSSHVAATSVAEIAEKPSDIHGQEVTSSKRSAAFELAVVLAASSAPRLVLTQTPLKDWLPRLSVLEHAWVYFLATVALFFWLLRRHRNSASSLGVKPFSPLLRTVLLGVAAAIVVVIVDIVTGPIVRSMFGQPEMRRFTALAQSLPIYLLCVAGGFVFGGFGEELLFRGIVLTRLRLLLGETRMAIAGAVLLQGIFFGLGHLYQGWSGVISITIVGVMYGLVFLASRSTIWPSAIAHGLIDALGFTLLFLGVMKT